MSLPSQLLAPVEAAPLSRLAGVVDVALRVLGGAVSVIAALVTAALEVLFAPLRVGGHLIGVSVVLAIAANAALSWFAPRAVGERWALALPSVAWLAAVVVAAGGTAEGDILLAESWVGLGMIFAGVSVFAVVAFRMVLTPRR